MIRARLSALRFSPAFAAPLVCTSIASAQQPDHSTFKAKELSFYILSAPAAAATVTRAL